MSEFTGATSMLSRGNRIRFGCGAMRCGAMRCGAMRCGAMRCEAVCACVEERFWWLGFQVSCGGDGVAWREARGVKPPWFQRARHS